MNDASSELAAIHCRELIMHPSLIRLSIKDNYRAVISLGMLRSAMTNVSTHN